MVPYAPTTGNSACLAHEGATQGGDGAKDSEKEQTVERGCAHWQNVVRLAGRWGGLTATSTEEVGAVLRGRGGHYKAYWPLALYQKAAAAIYLIAKFPDTPQGP